MIRKLFLLLIVLSVPALLFLNSWQAYRYEMTESEVTNLEEEQRDLLENNKILLIGVEVLSAPEHVETVVAEDGVVEKRGDQREVYIQVRANNGEGSDG